MKILPLKWCLIKIWTFINCSPCLMQFLKYEYYLKENIVDISNKFLCLLCWWWYHLNTLSPPFCQHQTKSRVSIEMILSQCKQNIHYNKLDTDINCTNWSIEHWYIKSWYFIEIWYYKECYKECSLFQYKKLQKAKYI